MADVETARTGSNAGRKASIVDAADEHRLAEWGYKQELKRDWSVLHNFGVSFSIISVVTGITTLFQFGLNTGGPGVMTSGWIVVTTGITFGCAGLISTLATVKSDYTPTAGRTLGIYAALLASHVAVNSVGVHILRYLNNVSIILHSAGVFSIAVAVVAGAPTHRSAKEVFATFYDGTGVDGHEGWSKRASPAYVAICGILLSQYTITGFDASAHLSEETRDASKSAPIGVLTSIGVSAVFGFFYLLCLLFSIQNFDDTVVSSVGQPVLQIFIDVFGDDGAIVLMTVVIICVWHCGLFSLTSNSRMMFAFSRDRALPRFFDHVDKRFQSPIRTICLAATLAFILALPSLGSAVAFSAATSIATIGLYISYAIPVLVGVIYHDEFVRVKGPFDLKGASRPVGIIACLWVAFITIVFCLPTQNPVDSQTLNYTPVAVGIVFVLVMGSWFPWARRWFTGPVAQITAEAAGIDIAHPGVLEEAEAKGEIPTVVSAGEKGDGVAGNRTLLESVKSRFKKETDA